MPEVTPHDNHPEAFRKDRNTRVQRHDHRRCGSLLSLFLRRPVSCSVVLLGKPSMCTVRSFRACPHVDAVRDARHLGCWRVTRLVVGHRCATNKHVFKKIRKRPDLKVVCVGFCQKSARSAHRMKHCTIGCKNGEQQGHTAHTPPSPPHHHQVLQPTRADLSMLPQFLVPLLPEGAWTGGPWGQLQRVSGSNS